MWKVKIVEIKTTKSNKERDSIERPELDRTFDPIKEVKPCLSAMFFKSRLHCELVSSDFINDIRKYKILFFVSKGLVSYGNYVAPPSFRGLDDGTLKTG